MFQFLNRIFGRSGPPAGLTMATPHMRDCAELIRRCVVAQFDEAGLPLMPGGASYRAIVLGYVATLAEKMGSRLQEKDPRSAGMLICFLAMEGVEAQSSSAGLMHEFTELTESRDYAFGQGGAIALEDFPALLKKVPPRGLALALMGRGTQRAG